MMMRADKIKSKGRDNIYKISLTFLKIKKEEDSCMKKRLWSYSVVFCMVISFITCNMYIETVYAGNTASELVSVAKGEIGNGYSKYTQYTGPIGGSYNYAWCASFVSWCGNQAGISGIGKTASCKAQYDYMIAHGGQRVSSPQAGDIVFFYCNSCSGTANQWCHIGIMIDSSTSIDGNYNNRVAYDRSYSHYGSLGYKHSTGISKIYVRPNFKSGKPSYSNFWLSRKNTSYTEYGLNDNVEVNIEASNYDHLTIGIDKDGVGRVVTKEISSHYVFPAKELGAGNYSVYITVSNSQGYVDTNTLWFKIQSKPTYLNFWLSKKNTSYTEYCLGDNIEVNVESANYDHLTVGINKDGVGRVVTKEITSHYVFSSKDLGVGNYNIYVTVANSQGYVDTNTLRFSIKKPQYESFTLSKASYELGENALVNVKASYYNKLVIGIDKDGVGRVVTKEIPAAYTFSTKELGVGNYSMYVSVYNKHGYYMDTKRINFKINSPKEVAHIYGNWVVTKRATCTTTGTEKATCKNCGKVETRIIKATGHAYKDTVVLPTTTKKGYTLHTCTKCGYSYKDNYTNVKKQLQSITITVKPDKLEYYLNDSLDTAGIKVVANYSDGSKSQVKYWRVSGTTTSLGKQTITISYSDNGITKTASYDIKVKEKNVKKESCTIVYATNGGLMSQTTQTGEKGKMVQISSEKPIKNITVKFNSNGASLTPSPLTLQQTFNRWICESASGRVGYYSGDSLQLTQNYILEAEYGEAYLNQLPEVEKEGYSFDGWYTENNEKAYKGMAIQRNLTLTAKWTKSSLSDDENWKDSDLNQKDDENWKDSDLDQKDDKTVEVGDEITTDTAIYTITKTSGTPTLELTEWYDDNFKTAVIKDSMVIDGVVYQVTSIGAKAFYKNDTLKNVIICHSIKKIDKMAFYGCKSLKSIVIDTLNLKSGSIGAEAFKKVNKNVRVYVPKSKYNVYKKLLKRAGIGSKAAIYKLKTKD